MHDVVLAYLKKSMKDAYGQEHYLFENGRSENHRLVRFFRRNMQIDTASISAYLIT